MLSSIHPLGERGRNNRWSLTVGGFVVGALSAAAMVGGALAALGSLLEVGSTMALGSTAAISIIAAVLDWRGIQPPGPQRQVNERWIGTYRGWVYGGAFGAQLGAGGATYIVTWLVYATAAAAFLAGSFGGGVVIGLVFGAVRAIPLVAARWIDRPSRLGAFHRRMAVLGPVVRTASIVVAAVVSLVAVGTVV